MRLVLQHCYTCILGMYSVLYPCCSILQVSLYCSGKSKVLGYFVGQVMMITNGRGDPQTIRTILLRKLNQS